MGTPVLQQIALRDNGVPQKLKKNQILLNCGKRRDTLKYFKKEKHLDWGGLVPIEND